MLIAEALAKKTDEARKETYVDRRFSDIVKTMNDRAAAMQSSLVIKKLTRYGLSHPAEVQWFLQTGSPMPEEMKTRFAQGEMEPKLVEELYSDQQKVNDRLTAEGFELTEKPIDLPSILDPKITEEVRQHVETANKLFECEVVISWEHLTTAKLQ